MVKGKLFSNIAEIIGSLERSHILNFNWLCTSLGWVMLEKSNKERNKGHCNDCMTDESVSEPG